MSNLIADPGFAYVCTACGKVSRDQYGYAAHSYGWDESCVLNCTLTQDKTLVARLEGIELQAKPID
jgi:transposase-like protein